MGRRKGSPWSRLLSVAVVISLLVALVWSTLPRPQGTQAGASLVDEPHGVLFDPGKGDGVRMRLDRPDVVQVSDTEFFRRNGWGNLSREGRPSPEWLRTYGFPTLLLSWPSLHLPQAWSCENGPESLADSCPVLAIEVKSEAMRDPMLWLHRGEVWQWTAFRTRRGSGGSEWAGWECDARRQQEMNRRIGAPDAERREWAVHPLVMQQHCGQARGFFERRLPWVAGVREHPVIWSCQNAAMGNIQPLSGACVAIFEHAGRLVTVQVPGRAWIGDAEHRMPAAMRLRPQIVEAAWHTLEDAAATAQRKAPVDWEGALRSELGWCEAMGARLESLRRTGRAAEAQRAREEPEWRISAVTQRGPCSRALHRVLRAWAQTPAQARPAPLLLEAAQRLAAVETAGDPMQLSRPLWALNKELRERQAGADSLPLLQWRVQQRYRDQEPAQIVASYDALREQVERMPPRERLELRLQLSRLASADVLAARRDELEWAFLRDWLANPGALELTRSEVIALLPFAAGRARRLPPAETRERLALLIPALQAQARAVAQNEELLRSDRLVSVATFALHAAWHANWMAVNDPNGDAWRQSLAEQAAWAETALPGTSTDWVAAVVLHRDAARRGRLTEPDCPGGALLQCRAIYQLPGYAR